MAVYNRLYLLVRMLKNFPKVPGCGVDSSSPGSGMMNHSFRKLGNPNLNLDGGLFFLVFTRKIGNMVQFDLRIFFKMG